MNKVDETVGDIVDFFFVIEAADTKTQAGVRSFIPETKSAENVRRLNLCRGAGRSAGERDLPKGHHQRLTLDMLKGHVEVAGEAVLPRAIDADAVEIGDESGLEVIAERGEASGFGEQFSGRKLAGSAEPDDGGDIQGSGAQAALVAASVNLLGDGNPRSAAAHVKGSDAFGAVKLVSRNGEQIDFEVSDVDGELAHGLRGIGVEENAAFAAESADFFDRLNRTDLIVREHD